MVRPGQDHEERRADGEPGRDSPVTLPAFCLTITVLLIPFSTNESLLDLSCGATLVLALGLVPVLGWAGWRFLRDRQTLPLAAPVTIAVSLLVAWCVVSSFLGIFPRASLRAVQLPLIVVLWLAVVPWPAHRGDALGMVHRAWVVAAVLMSLHAILQYAGLDPFYVTSYHGLRGQSVLRHPNILGGHLAMSLPMVLLAYPPAPGRSGRWCWIGMLLVILAGLGTTLSRGAWVAVFAGLPFYFICRSSYRAPPPPRRTLLRLGALSVIACAVVAILIGIGIQREEHTRLWSLHGVSEQTRLGQWRAAGSMVADRPWSGQGYGAYARVFPEHQPDALARLYPGGDVVMTDAASQYVQLLAETGILGAVLLLAAMVTIAGVLLRSLRSATSSDSRRSLAAVGAALAIGAVHATVNSSAFHGIIVADLLVLLGTLQAHRAPVSPAAPGPHRRLALTATLALVSAGTVGIACDSGRRTLSHVLVHQYDLQHDAGRHAQALQHLDSALAADPQNVEARYDRASEWYLEGDPERAYREYSLLLNGAPGYANVNYNLGVCALEMEQLDLARAWLTRSRDLHPYRPETVRLLGRLDEPR